MGCLSDTVVQAFSVPSSSSFSSSTPASTSMAIRPFPHAPLQYRTMHEDFELITFKRYPSPLDEEGKYQERKEKAGARGRSGIATTTPSHWTWECLCGGVADGDRILSRWKANTPPQWVDLLIIRRKPHLASSSFDEHRTRAEASSRSYPFSAAMQSTPVVQWEDTLEYDEYLPATLLTSYHWTDQLPTFSYLEDDFVDQRKISAIASPSMSAILGSCGSGSGEGDGMGGTGSTGASSLARVPEGNVLAHGPMTMEKIMRAQAATPLRDGAAQKDVDNEDPDEEHHSVPISAWKPDADAAAAMFKLVFREELRRKRRTSKKFQRMALSSSRDQQEWYIDEKLVKSEAAKVDFMNQIARFDFQENRDH